MNTLRASTIAACIATALLSACGGGSSGGLVQTPPPAAPPPVPPPPQTGPDFNPCPPPVTADCIVTLGNDEHRDMVPTTSDHRLILRGEGGLLLNDDNQFGAGTRIEGGTLILGGTLESDAWVGGSGVLQVHGGALLDGDVENLGTTGFDATITGSVRNAGRFATSGAAYGNALRIGGDFVQLPDATFAFTLAPAGWDVDQSQVWIKPLQVDGVAELAGTLELGLHEDDWGPYPLPEAREHHLIHADGGVSGMFADWTSPGLAITGEVRYGPNDVWFDLVRISLQSAAIASGVRSPLSVGSAINLDRALGGADRFARLPPNGLDEGQRQFLASAASVLWLQDIGQAQRTLDSLAGHAHAAIPDTLHRHGAQGAARLAARLSNQPYATGPQAWSEASGPHAAGDGLDGPASGIDQWLSPRLLVGAYASSARTSQRFEHMGGQARGDSPGMGLHVHYRNDGWLATGVIGAGRARMDLQRHVELGAAGTHLVQSRRSLAHAFAHAEVGRELALGTTRMVPFVALDYGLARSDGFAEQGVTGFELVAGPSRHARASTAVGARLEQDWDVGRHGLRLELDARWRRDLGGDDPVLASFRGVPDVLFELPTLRDPAAAAVRVGLDGGIGAGTRWSLGYARDFGQRQDGSWMLGLHRAF